MEKLKNVNRFLIVVLIFFTVEAVFFYSYNSRLDNQYLNRINHNANIVSSLDATPLLAKAVSIYNISTNEKVYGKNDGLSLPIASIAKIMTVVLGLNGHKMDDLVYISPEAVKQTGDFGIFAYEKWKISDLAKFTLVVSANDGAYELSGNGSADFINNLNIKSKKIGTENTSFINSTGLDIDKDHAGAFASASDVNIMAIYALKSYPEVFSATTLPEINLKSESGFEHNFKNTDTLIGKIPNLIFSKTGYTEVAGGNLVVIFRDKNGEMFAVTVLGSTYEGRFDDMEKIVNILYNA